MAEAYHILVLNGPNLQLLGKRSPEIYGTATLGDVEELAAETAAELGMEAVCRQSNHEGDLVDWIGLATPEFSGIVLNPGAYSHTSVAIHDAIQAVSIPTVEVHISNIHARETFRHRSVTAAACLGQISGLGIAGYALAIRALKQHLTAQS